MDIHRFTEIFVEEGYTEDEAEAIWTSGFKIYHSQLILPEKLIEDSIRETCKILMPDLKRVRERINEEGIDIFKLILIKNKYQESHRGDKQQGGLA